MHHNREDYSDLLEHRLDNSANARSPYPTFYQGLCVEPERPSPHGEFIQQTERGGRIPRDPRDFFDNNCALWIGNLDPRISETMLFELFSQVGTIRNITFPNKKQDSEPATRFCFVNFMMPDSVPHAINMMQGTVLFGRKLFLKFRPNSIHAFQGSVGPGPQPIHSPGFNEQHNYKWTGPTRNKNNNMPPHEMPETPPSSDGPYGQRSRSMSQVNESYGRSYSESSDQSLPFENDKFTRNFSPIRPPRPHGSPADYNFVLRSSSSYKTTVNRTRFVRKSPYVFHAAQSRPQNRKVYITTLSSSTNNNNEDEDDGVKVNTESKYQQQVPDADNDDDEYDPTDPGIR